MQHNIIVVSIYRCGQLLSWIWQGIWTDIHLSVQKSHEQQYQKEFDRTMVQLYSSKFKLTLQQFYVHHNVLSYIWLELLKYHIRMWWYIVDPRSHRSPWRDCHSNVCKGSPLGHCSNVIIYWHHTACSTWDPVLTGGQLERGRDDLGRHDHLFHLPMQLTHHLDL